MIVTYADIAAFQPDADETKVEALIADTMAEASSIPGFIPDEPDPKRRARLLGILRWAILRRLEIGTGAVRQRSESAGPFGTSETLIDGRSILTAKDRTDITAVYAGGKARTAFMINTTPRRP